eukprot:jgi/Botrbrau1/20785/Bobra.0156s0016.1
MWDSFRHPRMSDSAVSLFSGRHTSAIARLELDGLGDDRCAGAVEQTLSHTAGVLGVVVDMPEQVAQVTYNPMSIQPPAIVAAVEMAGFGARLRTNVGDTLAVTRLLVSGMTCASCSAGVERAIETVPGVHHAVVSLLQQEARVEHSPSVSPDALDEAVRAAGFGCRVLGPESRANVSFLVGGMSCASCSGAVERGLTACPGVCSASVSLLSNRAEVEFDPTVVGARDILQVITDLGFTAELIPPNRMAAGLAEREREKRYWWRKFKLSCVFSIPVLLLSMVMSYIPGIADGLATPVAGFTLNEILQWALTTPVQFVIGWNFHVGAVRALRRGAANMDVLVSMGTNAAYIYSIIFAVHARSLYLQGMGVSHMERMGYFETSALLITFISLGRALEAHARGKTSQAITKLMDLAPATATLVTEGPNGREEQEVPSALIQRDDLLKVMPGARIPVDGKVMEGRAHVDEAMVTGEPLPVAKGPGDEVVAGTVCSGSALLIQARRVGPDTTLAQIVRLVERAQLSKAPIQAFADRISSVFVPVVLLLALATWLAWFLAGNAGSYPADWRPMGSNPFLFALLFGITVLVIACPCALGLATPTAVMVGTGVAASHGILIKGANALEAASNLKILLFDKTGTLTEGRPAVTGLHIFHPHISSSEVLHLAAAAEAHSEHPLARAIMEYARQNLCPEPSRGSSPGDQDLGSPGSPLSSMSPASPSSPASLASPSALSSASTVSNARNIGWIRAAHDVDVIVGKGVRCWVATKCSPGFHASANISLPSTPRVWQQASPRGPLERFQSEPAAFYPGNPSDGDRHMMRVLLGNRRLLKEEGIPIPTQAAERIRRMEAGGGTVVLMAVGSSLAAALSITDPIRKEAAGVVAALRNMGIACYLVTGDHWPAARSVAARLGIQHVLAEVPPDGKAAKVKELQDVQRVAVGMVGDGINDSPALAQADVGIAVGSGTEIAIEAADYVLMRSDLEDVLLAIHLSKRTLRHIYLNYFWAMGYNTLMIPLAAGALYPPLRWALPPWLAGAAMAASSLCVVGCSLLLRRYKRPPRVLRSLACPQPQLLVTSL